MHLVLPTPSLQHVAGVKIVAQLWTQPDIFTQIARSYLSIHQLNEYEPKWKEIEEKVRSKVWAVSLPETCKKELLNLIKPIGVEIVNWCNYHHLDDYLFQMFDTSLPRQFCWSMRGIIEFKKTAESMVKDERLSVESRFEVACLNCLEDEARQLIGSIPNQQIHKYISEAARHQNWEREHPRILIAYFVCTLSGDEDLLHRLFPARKLGGWSIRQYLFQVVLWNGPRSTCEYFFGKVSRAEKEQVYSNLPFRPQQTLTCGLMFYLWLMEEEEDDEDEAILLVLLRWPMQPLFMEKAKRIWQSMTSYDCAVVLYEVIDKIVDGFEDYDYAQWFWELWGLSPSERKHDFLDDSYQLAHLISTKRNEFIQLVFNKAPPYLLNELVEKTVQVLTDEMVISDVILMECKENAALKSLKDEDNEEKRLRSQHLSRLVDMVMERRIKSKEKAMD